MLKLNDSFDKSDVGRATDASFIQYAALDKFKHNDNVKLKKIICIIL
jgi:hypothetical protein